MKRYQTRKILVQRLFYFSFVIMLMVAFLFSLLPSGRVLAIAGMDPEDQISDQQPMAPGDQIFQASGTLVPGEIHAPGFPVFSDRTANLKLSVPEAVVDGSIELTFVDGTGASTVVGTILDGETLWATVMLKAGASNNIFRLENISGGTGPTLQYSVQLFEVAQTPYSWSGSSQDIGTWRSHIKLNFPTGGIYQFDFGKTSGRYQFLVDNEYIQKTVEDNGTVGYYVAAGNHTLTIEPDSQVAKTAWSLNISAAGTTVNTLPYAKEGGNLGGVGEDFTEEWLSLNLASSFETNLVLTLTGTANDVVDVHFYSGETGNTLLHSVIGINANETVWWSKDLPAGVSRVKLVAGAGNIDPISYEFVVDQVSSLPEDWAGDNKAVIRFNVDNAGLYVFNYGVSSGRYQFLVASDAHIQKTVEADGSVTYYLAAGTHELNIEQDSALGAKWSLAITATGETNDTLPYIKTGGELGGVGNDFGTEILPLSVASGSPANFELSLDGDNADGLVAYLFQGNTAVYTTPVVYGTETFWWTTDLAAGVNQIKLEAESGNTSGLDYDITVHEIPTPAVAWNGVSLNTGGNSETLVNIETAGTYRINLDTAVGFAYILVDESVAHSQSGIQTLSTQVTEFDVPLSAGNHRFSVIQDPSYPETEWAMSVNSATAGEIIASLTGNLEAGEQHAPQVPLFGSENKEVNFSLVVSGGGGPLDLAITDGSGGTAFAATAYDGETVWGTTTLKPGQNIFQLENTGASALAYDLTVYEIASAGYAWVGISDTSSIWNSHIRLDFPSATIYDFDFTRTSGRYQFMVDDEYVQKTVDVDGTVGYFIPAGRHDLMIVPDRTGVDTSWALDISAPGAAFDTLPYEKEGGELWDVSANFNEEWLPVNLSAGTAVNFEFSLAGTTGDKLDVYLYDATDTVVYTVTDVYAGETLWWTTDLVAGTSRVNIQTDAGNSSSLTYNLAIRDKPSLVADWAGISNAVGNNSELRFEAPTAGLYDFNFDVPGGRYQFLVDSTTLIQKTAEISDTVRYYLDAGTHELTVVQDTALGAEWALEIVPTTEVFDTLPYQKNGGELGGTGNDFFVEWLPLNYEEGSPVNVVLTLDGLLADGMVAYLYQGSTLVYTSPVVYGGETFWWASSLATGVNQVKLVAESGNVDILQYDLTVSEIPMVTYGQDYSWSGLSKGLPSPVGNSEISIQVPVTATYHVVVDIPVGYATLNINNPSLLSSVGILNSGYEFDVPLAEGSHLFEVIQGTSYVTTTWAITVSLKEAAAPQVFSVDPDSALPSSETLITITGRNFMPAATVMLDTYTLSNVTWLSSTTLTAVVSAGMPVDVYDLTVINPDSQQDTLADAFEVLYYTIYMPLVTK